MADRLEALDDYLTAAPLSLASERAPECALMTDRDWPRPILDIGCGDGIFARFAQLGPIDVGIDPNLDDIKQAQQSGAYQQLIVCEGCRIPLAAESYGTVFSNSVLEHIPDALAVLIEIYRVLKPDGCFYLTVPSDRFEHAAVINRLLESLGMPRSAARFRQGYNSFWCHYNALSRAEWKALFAEAGFEVVDVIAYNPRGFATLNDILAVLGLPSFVCRRLTGRWIAFRALRCFYTGAIAFVFRPLLQRLARGEDPTLLFFSLKKSAP